MRGVDRPLPHLWSDAKPFGSFGYFCTLCGTRRNVLNDAAACEGEPVHQGSVLTDYDPTEAI